MECRQDVDGWHDREIHMHGFTDFINLLLLPGVLMLLPGVDLSGWRLAAAGAWRSTCIMRCNGLAV